MARSRTAAPSLAVTRSAAPAVNLVLGYAAPELAAWVSAHREAVLRAAEAVETAYMAAVDELASRLPGGVGAWERARGSVRFYDSEREEHLARPPTTVENVEGWQSRATDPNGYRSVVALLPVRSLNVANRWVHGFGSANGSAWEMTRLAPSPETPLELAGYDVRRMGVPERAKEEAPQPPRKSAFTVPQQRMLSEVAAVSPMNEGDPRAGATSAYVWFPWDYLNTARALHARNLVSFYDPKTRISKESRGGDVAVRILPLGRNTYAFDQQTPPPPRLDARHTRMLAEHVRPYKRDYAVPVAFDPTGDPSQAEAIRDYLAAWGIIFYRGGEWFYARGVRREIPVAPPVEVSQTITSVGVDVSQQTGEDGGGGSTMPTNKKPVLDPIHELVLEAFRLERRKPLAEGEKREIQKFSKTDVHWFLQPFFSPEAIKAVGEPTMMRRAAKALLDSGDLVPAGFLNHVAFAPAEPLSRLQYGVQRRAIRARSDEAARLTREQTVVPQPTTSGGKISSQPVLDPMHELVLEAYLLEAVRPPRYADEQDSERYAGFSPSWVSSILRDCKFSARAQNAVVRPTYPGISSPPSFMKASQIKHVRDALVSTGAVVPAERNGSGAVVGWRFAPATPLSLETYEQARAALAARAAALVADGTPLGDKLAFDERMRAGGRRG